MIDYATVQRIIETAEITDVVSDFVSLRKRGVNLLGLCPFHNEKTPSFTVSPAKGIFKCFGCGKGGNAVNFIMEHESLSYPDALRWLAKKYHIEIVEKEETEEEKQLKDDRESMMIVTSFAQQYFSDFLWNENEGKTIGLSYFYERGFRDDTIKQFDLGYSPDGNTPFTDAARKKGYKIEFLEKTGLTIKRDNWERDRFAGRVIFPIHNLAGRVVGFGGRLLKNDPKAAKYLNSPESEIYHKSKILYGIFQAKRSIMQEDRAFLVEGYTDVISMHQAGINNVVASSGTALTPDQIRLIKRFTENVTIIFDGDNAGIKASLRGIDLILAEGLNVKVLLLPDGEDPDSFAQAKGSSKFLDYINENQTDFIQFKTKLLLKNAKNDPIAKAQLITNVIKSVAIIPDNVTRSVYLKECSKLLDVNEEILYAEVRKQKRKQYDDLRIKTRQKESLRTKTVEEVPIPTSTNNKLLIEEREFLKFLIKYYKNPIFEEDDDEKVIRVGEYMIEEIEKDNLVSDNELFKIIFHELKQHLSDIDFDAQKHFIYHNNTEVSKLSTDLLSERFVESKRWSKAGAYSEKEEDILHILITKIIHEYRFKKVKIILKEIEKEITEASQLDDFDKVIDLQSKYLEYKKVSKILSSELGNRTIS